jgi:hypothetical protein
LLQCRDALAATLHHAASSAVQVSIRRHPLYSLARTLAETRCLQESASCSGALGIAVPSRSAAQVSGMAILPRRAARFPAYTGPHANRAVNSAVFHNATLNAHIEWRFS